MRNLHAVMFTKAVGRKIRRRLSFGRQKPRRAARKMTYADSYQCCGLLLLICSACGGAVEASDGGLDAGADDAESAHDVNGDASVDAADVGDDDGQSCFRRVFVTSEIIAPQNISSPPDADAVCGQVATNAGLSGSWLAWISTSVTSASQRLEHATTPYRLIDGTLVAANWTELTSGTLQHPIDTSEHGQQVAQQYVITGTLSNGEVNPNNTCNDWSGQSNALTTQMGLTSSASQWSNTDQSSAQTCDGGLGGLDCFEQ